MKRTDTPAFIRILEKFKTGEYELGNTSNLSIYSYYPEISKEKLTPGHFVDAIRYCKLDLCEIPKEYQTREFFLHSLSGVHKDVLEYVKANLGKQFDRQFFKDHIATDNYSIDFEENCFEYMPLEYIDEEMISCAMIKAVIGNSIDRRGDFDDWFYSVAKRKPEVLTQDFWILGARIFAAKRNGVNKFLEITPEEYKTEEYYFMMCMQNDTPVMEDFPKEIITNEFLVALIHDNVNNIKSFSNDELERKVKFIGENKEDEVTFWQAAILINGYIISYIPLNEERVEFFKEHYNESSGEYKIGFYDSYKRWLRKQESK
ncbi:MAG: hypothetical protein E7311_01230 [Clostridiales bacterium]|nr:hypothetical protein [Clostridiales bacterium]